MESVKGIDWMVVDGGGIGVSEWKIVSAKNNNNKMSMCLNQPIFNRK